MRIVYIYYHGVEIRGTIRQYGILCQDYSWHIGNILFQDSMTEDICLKHLYLIISADYPKQGVTSGNENKYLGWKTSSAKCSSPRCC